MKQKKRRGWNAMMRERLGRDNVETRNSEQPKHSRAEENNAPEFPESLNQDQELTAKHEEPAEPVAPAQIADEPGGKPEGVVEVAEAGAISGWVWDPSRPDEPLRVSISLRGIPLGSVSADIFRRDLLNAGKGNGRHGFRVEFDSNLRPDRDAVACEVKELEYVVPIPHWATIST